MLDAPASNDLAWSTAHQLADEFASGHLNASTIIEAALTRIRSLDPSFNSFTAVTEQRAYHRAKELDDARERGERLGPLAGVPFAVKNLFDIAGLPTLAGSKINREQKPSQRDAALIERLERAGAILVGALNMGEYAYDFTGENIHDGPSRNPHDLKRMTGGSSGGSGGAVAGWCRLRSARTPTARSAYHPHAAGFLGSNRPMAGLVVQERFRSWQAWTTSAH